MIQKQKDQKICENNHQCLIGTSVGLVFHHWGLMGAGVGHIRNEWGRLTEGAK